MANPPGFAGDAWAAAWGLTGVDASATAVGDMVIPYVGVYPAFAYIPFPAGNVYLFTCLPRVSWLVDV